MEQEKKNVSASEAVYGFAAWLTTSDKPVTFSSKHDAGKIAKLVDDYCKAQGFEDPREGIYPKNLVSMGKKI